MAVGIYGESRTRAKSGTLAIMRDDDRDVALFIVDANGDKLVSLGYWDADGDFNLWILSPEDKAIAVESGLALNDRGCLNTY